MCGIAVAIDWPGADEAVRRMMAGIAHRGDVSDPLTCPRPDTAMATRRLRIVDAARGSQPQASFDGKLLVSFNGEIYNHAELRNELEALGVSFRTECDTEVLANALQVWGPSALKRLSGMYAFVAIDAASGAFLAARDPFGVKPLYLVQTGAGFLFCSEIAPLLAAAPEGEVLLLPPGFLLTRNLCRQFHTLPAQPVAPSAQALDALLDAAVRKRLPEGLPCAALFSGGIDSTLMLHYARRYRPDMPGYFIGGADAPDYVHAMAYAERTGLDLRMLTFAPDTEGTLDALAAAAQAVESFEPAVVRPSLHACLLSQRIQQDGFRVALCGEGADEIFAGYVALEQSFAQGQALGRHVQEQALSLMNRSNLQRVDRCGMRFGLEIREPFLDHSLAEYALGLDGAALVRTVDGAPQGKQPLRALYDLYPDALPASIRDRRKVPFDEGAGLAANAWRTLFEETVSDADFAEGKREFAAFEIASKEELFYIRALARRMDVHRVPHLKGRLRLTVPQEALAAAAG